MTYRHTWGEHRVYFHDGEGHLCSLPARWTSVVAPDPFVAVAAGRSYFRMEDLLALSALLRSLQAVHKRGDSGSGSGPGVKGIMP